MLGWVMIKQTNASVALMILSTIIISSCMKTGATPNEISNTARDSSHLVKAYVENPITEDDNKTIKEKYKKTDLSSMEAEYSKIELKNHDLDFDEVVLSNASNAMAGVNNGSIRINNSVGNMGAVIREGGCIVCVAGGSASGDVINKYRQVMVYYGTSRKSEVSDEKGVRFTEDRADSVSYGSCTVSIPETHRVGEIERPWSISSLSLSVDKNKHMNVENVKLFDKEEFVRYLGEINMNEEEKQAFVYVHGYNNTFEDAALRTAQLAYDLDFKGIPVFYSWASKGSIEGYLADSETVVLEVDGLVDFLKDLQKKTGVKRIHLIAHSMGSRAVTLAFVEMMGALNNESMAKIDNLILASPDISEKVFRSTIYPKLKSGSQNITIYASENDKALNVSHDVNKHYRLGQVVNGKPFLYKGIYVIDASNVSTDFTGHDLFAANQGILSDIHSLIRGERDPSRRFGLRMVIVGSDKYWVADKLR